MDRQRIEIKPGVWIEVTPKIRQAVGARKRDRVLATMDGATKDAINTLAKPRRKHSDLLLDEGLALAQKDGFIAASKRLGINYHTLISHNRKRRLEQGKRKLRARGFRYTLTQKLACVKLALELMASDKTREVSAFGKHRRTVPLWTKDHAFNEAGRRLGINGHSVYVMWAQGDFRATQQPST
jgi:hypothetical protein